MREFKSVVGHRDVRCEDGELSARAMREMISSKCSKLKQSAPASRTICSRYAIVLLVVCQIISLPATLINAQDLLRHQRRQSSHDELQNLANIQLPPQLAALTPQQLRQLAQLRELQLQQQQQQQAAAEYQASQMAPPAPVGLENITPTSQPNSISNTQIPQPNLPTTMTSTSSISSAQGVTERAAGLNDDMSSSMDGTDSTTEASNDTAGETLGNMILNSGQPSNSTSNQTAPVAPTFEVNWNKCPQLEPSEVEKNKKTQVITKCLQAAPIPTNLTRENVEAHREQIATCALRIEGWFDDAGNYKYDKAESEIRGKKLEAPIELQVLKFHIACKDEAVKKFPREQNKLIDQVQFYQACMDYYISIVCEIEVSVDQ